jgi:hypothetical protein
MALYIRADSITRISQKDLDDGLEVFDIDDIRDRLVVTEARVDGVYTLPIYPDNTTAIQSITAGTFYITTLGVVMQAFTE